MFRESESERENVYREREKIWRERDKENFQERGRKRDIVQRDTDGKRNSLRNGVKYL